MKNFQDKRIISIYLIVFALLIIGVTYALQSSSLAFQTSTALIQIDETAYGNTSFDSSNLEFKPILDSAVETSTNNVIKIEFKVGGAEANNANNIIYDIALNDLEVNCSLLSPYIKWKLLKNGTEISNGSLDYKFDTIADGRMVLTTIQQDLPDYNATDKSQYDDYIFYMWFSDSCQSSDLSTCVNNNQLEDQSAMINQNLSGKVEVELYTESKKELVRNPSSTLDTTLCQDNYVVTFNLDGGSIDSTTYYVSNGQPYGQLPTPTKETTVITYDTQGGTLASGASSPQEINWTFDGWYLENNFTNLVTNDTIVTIASNHTLYAKWAADSSNTLPNVTKSGYIFQGWYSAATGGTKIGDAGDNYKVGGTVTLYARWKSKTYTVTLNNQSATSAGTTSVTATYGSAMPAITKPERIYTVTYNANGGSVGTASATSTYTFLGYYTETGGNGTQYYTSSGSSARDWNLLNNTTLYANWSNGSVTLPTPSRSNWTFNGWYTAASGGTKIGNAGASYAPSENITLYAQWSPNVTSISATSYTTHYTSSTAADTAVTIKATYADGSTKSVSTNASSYTTNNTASSTTRYTFTVSYGGQSTTYTANKLGWYGSGGTWYYYLVPADSGNSIERITQASYNSYWSGKAKGTKLAGNWAKILQPSRGKFHWYYFNSDGTMKTGWWNSGSAWYYFVEYGVTVTGWAGPVGSMVACSNGNEADDTASTCANSGNRTISGSSTASWNGTYQFDYSGKCISSNC